MIYKTEFFKDDWPSDTIVAAFEAAGFDDTSWGNDENPSFSPQSDCVRVFVDSSDRAAPRFIVCWHDGDYDWASDYTDTTDIDEAIAAALTAEAARIARNAPPTA